MDRNYKDNNNSLMRFSVFLSAACRRSRLYLQVIIFMILLFSFFISPLLTQQKNSIYYNNEGWKYLERGDDFKAVISFKEALKGNSKYKNAVLGLGKAYLNTEAYDEALKLFNDVLKLDRDNMEAVNGIGFALSGLGKYDDALHYFDISYKAGGDDLEARYGMAHIYYLTGRTIWAKRKLDTILKINPYHYKSLLLMGELKSGDNRFEEARSLIQKAIDSNPELPEGYIRFGQVLFREYKRNEDEDYLNESIDSFRKALAIHPDNLRANRCLGHISLLLGNFTEAAEYFEKSLAAYPGNALSLYNLGVAYSKAGETDKALNSFMMALKKTPSDNVILAKLEDFLALNNFAIGNPMRVKLSDDHFARAQSKFKTNLFDSATVDLNRSLMLNPLNRTARETLMNNYLSLNYHMFYVDELKTLYGLYPENKYQDMLSLAIIKRRDMLYQRTGYSSEMPQRDVPVVLVLDFYSQGAMSLHYDAGEVIANYITFVMGETGRKQPVNMKKRLEIAGKLKWPGLTGDNLEVLSGMVKDGSIESPDYVVYGSYMETSDSIAIDFELLDFHTGAIINNFKCSENGRDSLSKIALRASEKLYDSIPYKGRVLKTDEETYIVNLGLYDGIRPGDMLITYRIDSSEEEDRLNIRKKIVLLVTESDTLLSSAKLVRNEDAEYIDIDTIVYPQGKRRAKLLK